MVVRITIDIFSGRPNPIVELEGPEARDAVRRLQPTGKPTRPLSPRLQSRLGYRGLLIELSDERVGELPTSFRLFHGGLFGRRLSGRATDERFEEYICGSAGPIRRVQLGPGLEDLIRTEVAQSRSPGPRRAPKRPKRPPRRRCQCAPLYEPAWWNDG